MSALHESLPASPAPQAAPFAKLGQMSISVTPDKAETETGSLPYVIPSPVSMSPMPEMRMVSEHKRLELEGKLEEEPLLAENPGRFVLFPIQHEE
ncbi:hypothetical protein TeGR_g6274, partial [Tetraparma gracilis]